MKQVREEIVRKVSRLEIRPWEEFPYEIKVKLVEVIENKIESDIFFRSKNNESSSYGVFSVE